MLESTSPARDAPCAQRRAQRPPEASGLGHLQQALQGVQGGGSPLGLTQVLPHSSLHSAPASLLQQACAAGFFLASSVQATLTHWSAVCAHRDRVPSPGGSCRARVTHFWHFQRGGVQVPSRTPATPTTSSATKDFTAAKVTHGQAPRSAHATAPPCYVLTSPIVASLHNVC